MSRFTLVALMSLILGPFDPRPALAGSTEGEVNMEISAGHDSNPLELNNEAPLTREGALGGSFTQVVLGSRLAKRWSSRGGWFVAAQGRGRVYPSSLEEADTAQGRVEAGVGLVLLERGERRLSAALHGSFGLDRSTFVDPATGETYLVGSDPNLQMAIPDRFDSSVTSMNLDLRLRTSRRILLMLDTSLQREDFADAYDQISTLEPLDNRSLTLQPGVRWQMSERVRLEVTSEWARLRYDGLSALESDGTTASGPRRSYRVGGLRAILRAEPSGRWSFSVGLGASDRRDLHAGYYDSSGANAVASVAWALVARTRVALNVSQAIYDYERATLDDSSNGDLRGGDTLRASARVEQDLVERLAAFVEGGTQRSNNQDPLYTYDRHWAFAGLRYRL